MDVGFYKKKVNMMKYFVSDDDGENKTTRWQDVGIRGKTKVW